METLFNKTSPGMVSSLETTDPKGQAPSRSVADPAVSTNKHLTRLVRFSILQARRSSNQAQASKNSINTVPTSPTSPTSPRGTEAPPASPMRQSVAPAKYPFAFGADKERPSTEVQYAYTEAPTRLVKGIRGGIGSVAVVDVPADPPIIEDISASLTISAGEQSYSAETISDENDHEDMDLLLAPDSGEMTNQPSHSSELYDSTEMYSSSGNYGGGSNSSCANSDSSDSIMKRVEQEIANARKASSEAQARLAYFTQKQKELAPIVMDSYSFDFENLETSGDLRSMLDVSGDGDDPHPHPHRQRQQINSQPPSPSYQELQRQRRIPWSPTRSYGSIHDDSYNNAMGVIGKEFDNGSADVQEKVDIEVILAPSRNNPSSSNPNDTNNVNNRLNVPPSPLRRDHSHHKQPVSPLSNPSSRRAPPGRRIPTHYTSPPRQPRHYDDSVDIDEAVISAVFSEKSIESLPVRGSLQDLFSEPSMDSLPTQQTPAASYSFQDTNYVESTSFAMSPANSLSPKKRHISTVTRIKSLLSPAKQQSAEKANVSIETNTGASFASLSQVNSISSPVPPASPPTKNNSVTSPSNYNVTSPSRRSSKLPSTPREPSTPSYRERLENKLKILGSRYPTSPARSSLTPNFKKDKENGISLGKPPESESQSKATKKGFDLKNTQNSPSNDTIITSSARATTSVASPLGETYDGLESRIKDLLARTLNPTPAQGQQHPGDRDSAYQSSPSAELKAIKKLLGHGVAAAAAAEARKREQEEHATTASDRFVPVDSGEMQHEADDAEDLTFPELAVAQGTSKDGPDSTLPSKPSTSKSMNPVGEGIRLLPRSMGHVHAFFGSEGEATKEPEPSVTCSTSEEILVQLDSFSQSTEFKSKSRRSPRSASPRIFPAEIKDSDCDCDDFNTKAEGALDRSDSVLGIAEESKKGVKSAIATFLNSAVTPSNSHHGNAEEIKSQKEALQTMALSYNNSSDKVQAKVSSVQLKASAPDEKGELELPVEIDEIKATEHIIKVTGSAADAGVETAEKGDKSPEGSRKDNPSHEHSVSSGDQHLQAVAKKTPSVLNAALCRPCPSENRDSIKDRKSNEKKSSQSRTQATGFSSQKDDASSKKANVPVRASSSQGSVNSRESHGPSTSSARETNDGSRSLKDATQNSSTEVFADFDPSSDGYQDSETRENRPVGTADSQETSPKLPNETNKNPIGDSESSCLQTALSPKPSKPSNESKEATFRRNQTSPPAKKSVSLQAPPTPPGSGDEKVLVAGNVICRNDITNLKSSRQDRKIRFRDPYPTPRPCRKPRSNEEIQRDYSCPPSRTDKQIRWQEPKGDLKRLLVAALDASLSRRSNACGALKVISKLEKNKVVLVRTTGFLEALVFVATDEVSSSSEPDLKEDARARAVSCIYNVSNVKENRSIVCTHPGLLECLVKTITEDRGEARMEACGVLAQLAKNSMCRDVMASVEELLSTLASVLKGTIDPAENMIDMLSQDITEEVPSSYSEMSSVLSEEHIPFPKTGSKTSKSNKVRPNCSIRKQKSEMYDQYFELARLSACAALIHLSKQCSVLVSSKEAYSSTLDQR
jgi:hypothetical protein